MSRDSSYKQILIQYRLEEAKEALQDAQLLYEQNGAPRSVVNRAYYAMFYAVLGLLITIDKGSSKHRGVIAMFDQEFIKQNIFPKEMSAMLHQAFDMRLTGDYRELLKISKEQAAEILNSAVKFVKSIEEQLSKSS
jgi:uncharacterized protein (UPF0332 family)